MVTSPEELEQPQPPQGHVRIVYLGPLAPHWEVQGVFGDRADKKILALTGRSKIARYSLQVVAFVLPFVLGLAAALMGGSAMTAIERSGGTRAGNFQAVFAIMIGGFAAVIGGCMIVSVYVWPHLPSLYTQ